MFDEGDGESQLSRSRAWETLCYGKELYKGRRGDPMEPVNKEVMEDGNMGLRTSKCKKRQRQIRLEHGFTSRRQRGRDFGAHFVDVREYPEGIISSTYKEIKLFIGIKSDMSKIRLSKKQTMHVAATYVERLITINKSNLALLAISTHTCRCLSSQEWLLKNYR